jgi:hypothetical protein
MQLALAATGTTAATLLPPRALKNKTRRQAAASQKNQIRQKMMA